MAAVEQGLAGPSAEVVVLGIAVRLPAFVEATALIAAQVARVRLANVAAMLSKFSLPL